MSIKICGKHKVYKSTITDDSSITKQYHVKIEEGFETNPWFVEDASAFLKYCCPECDYNDSDLKVFSNHALENHERSSTLINDINKMIPRNSSEVQVYLNLKPSNFETDIESQHDHALKETVKEEVFEDYENTEENYDYDRDSMSCKQSF